MLYYGIVCVNKKGTYLITYRTKNKENLEKYFNKQSELLNGELLTIGIFE